MNVEQTPIEMHRRILFHTHVLDAVKQFVLRLEDIALHFECGLSHEKVSKKKKTVKKPNVKKAKAKCKKK